MRGEAPDLPPIATPTRVLWGGRDPVLKAEWMDRLPEFFTDLEASVAEEAGHFVQMEQPELAAGGDPGLLRADEPLLRAVSSPHPSSPPCGCRIRTTFAAIAGLSGRPAPLTPPSCMDARGGAGEEPPSRSDGIGGGARRRRHRGESARPSPARGTVRRVAVPLSRGRLSRTSQSGTLARLPGPGAYPAQAAPLPTRTSHAAHRTPNGPGHDTCIGI